ncbi:MAG: ROK family protein [Candidatus Schekmanbacteria bacterium]|nr:MAG: ROK family protein [Candidatus Schekmanbacteria bacterium]
MTFSNTKKKVIAAALDYGGTKILAGLIDSTGKIISKKKIQTPSKESKKRLVLEGKNLLEEISEKGGINLSDTAGLGISLPGMVDNNGEKLIYAPNWKMRNFYVKREFEKILGIRTVIANDINAAAIGEMILGHGKKIDSFFWLTISTGIGGALVIDKKLITGDNGLAGEIGHIKIYDRRLKCSCGKYGCLEAISSGPAILKRTKERIKSASFKRITALKKNDLTTEKIVAFANRGDEGAQKILDECSSAVGKALSYIVNLTDIETIIIGGGVMDNNPLMFRLIKRYIKEYVYEEKLRRIKLLKPKFRYDSCLIGAASLIFNQENCST